MRSRALVILLAGLVTVGLSGCTFGAVQATRLAYDPSDGVSTKVGDIYIQNALLISETGDVGNLVVSVINDTNSAVSLTVTWPTDSGSLESEVLLIGEDEVRTFGTETNPLIIENIDAPPGSLFPLYFQYADFPGSEINTPVLTGALDSYSDLVPEDVADQQSTDTETTDSEIVEE
ncbi:hypothetical protein [Marisediminicola antarctica]|uniref:DNA modification methylase n=1 Tax=Marisediminicola antarctica TaxID=674079 RepID=A0A7L5AFE0_9MICO|nr:hypothetical protein [Marisediminicola antarctica]QHO69180.1 hypothetical protein BHD05_05460 [Marisediminicola antarctica]